MRIHIEDLRVDTIIGILEFERTSKQLVVVNIEIDYSYREGQFIDYSNIVNMVERLFKIERYGLLEDAIEGIGSSILDEYPQIDRLYLKIAKPEIIKNTTVALSREWK